MDPSVLSDLKIEDAALNETLAISLDKKALKAVKKEEEKKQWLLEF